MFVITSIKKGITALSKTNNSVEYHNQLFGTDDCVITEDDDAKYTQPKPTPAEDAKAREIAQNKAILAQTDYKILKKLEKLLPADDADVLERQAKRDRINQLEAL